MALEFKINLKGWKAVAAIFLVVVFAGCFYAYKFYLTRITLKNEALEAIGFYLMPDYVGKVLGEVDSSNPGPESAEKILSACRIEFKSVSARGTEDNIIVRIEPLVNGQSPPDGRSVRYYKMSYSLITGWQVQSETNAWSYYLKLF